jgi:hypothetical protein
LTFFVQLKAASVSSIEYLKPEEAAWIRSLEIPFFIGRVYLTEGKIELFSTQRLHQVLLEKDHQSIELLLDGPESNPTSDGRREVSIGPHVHSWSLAETRDSDLVARTYSILRPHILGLQANRMLRAIQSHRALQWEPGQPPVPAGEIMMIRPGDDIADTLNAMATHARRLMLEVNIRKRYADFPILLQFFDLMRRWGVDPDPHGMFSQMTGAQAQGPEITLEQAIHWRYTFQRTYLNLAGLTLTNESLGIIPADVSNLALFDAAINDDGVSQLLRLQNLSCLNLDGTKITENGLQLLSALPKLKWLSVKRTEVPPEGIDRLKQRRPEIAIESDSVPDVPADSPLAT